MSEVRMVPLYQIFAGAFQAAQNCEATGDNETWRRRWRQVIKFAELELPSGSGFDVKAAFADDTSKPDKLMFYGAYHKTDEYGGYDGWTDFQVIVKPDFLHTFYVRVIGGNRDFKDYSADVWSESLRAEYDLNAWIMQAVEAWPAEEAAS